MSSTRQSSDSSNSFGSTSGNNSNGRRAGTRLAIMRRNSDLSSSSCYSESSTVQYPWDGYYKDKPIVAEGLPGWTIVQIGLRITSLFLAGVVAGCSIRGYLTGLILWLPLVRFFFLPAVFFLPRRVGALGRVGRGGPAVRICDYMLTLFPRQSAIIFIWEVLELLVFAANRTHGMSPMAHMIMELIISLGALAYTGLSVWEVFVFRGYRSIVEFAVVTALCGIISGCHSILFVRAMVDHGSKRRTAPESNYNVYLD